MTMKTFAITFLFLKNPVTVSTISMIMTGNIMMSQFHNGELSDNIRTILIFASGRFPRALP